MDTGEDTAPTWAVRRLYHNCTDSGTIVDAGWMELAGAAAKATELTQAETGTTASARYDIVEVPATPMTRVQVGEGGRYRFADAGLAARFLAEHGGTPLGTGPWVVRGGPPKTPPLAPPRWEDRRPWAELTPAQRRKATGERDLWPVKRTAR